MAKSTRQNIFEGMEYMQEGLKPFVTRRMETKVGNDWRKKVLSHFPKWQPEKSDRFKLDTLRLLQIMNSLWDDAFREVLDRTHRSIVNELIDVRNRLAHDEKFSYDDAERALDSMRRLLEAVSASESAEKIDKMRNAILRTKFSELTRNEERKKTQSAAITTETPAGLLPWKEVVEPHQDVATGDFQQAEFAADLAKVHGGSASSEYGDPVEFFSRTYITDGLGRLLENAAKRLSNEGGDPVVELQTNFGGGKTHSMLALYHLVGGKPVGDLPGLDQLLSEQNLTIPEKVSRAVLVGTAIGPSDIQERKKKYGRKISTTWGEMAFQLGGEKVFKLIEEQDSKGIAPGSEQLEEIFRKCAPCLILIDEWIAYLRQIYKVDGLPSGSFDANISFVQSLTEAVKASPQTLLVASLPASQIEVGGEGGKEALDRLKHTFSRVESSWRPASQEESYEIVRRRLFKQIPGDNYMHRDNTLKQFSKLYRENLGDFPQGCAEEDYRNKMEKAYPIHPDLFDHLYTAWGSLEKFQRTRGVLRLMAQVIHELWMANDASVMIMPGNIAIGSSRVNPELLRYLDISWQSIIPDDIDGPNSTPYKIDQAAPNLNRYSATRRVAHAVFMATAPSEGQQHPGIDDKRINLGVVQPGEKTITFGDALRRLTNQAKYMHSEQGRHWYSTSPSLNRMASDHAAQLEEGLVTMQVNKELIAYIDGIGDRGHFDAVQTAPDSSAEVPDEAGGIRAVILSVSHPHTGREGSDALSEAYDIILQRGKVPRVYRNTLVFLAADNKQLDSLKDAVRDSLAWDGMVHDASIERLDLRRSEIALVKHKAKESRETMQTCLKETWCHLIYPYQESAESDVAFTSSKIPSQDGVLSRASKKLVSDEALLPEIGPDRLNRELEKYIWNDKPHLHLKDIWEYLNRYTYLPRLKNRETLIQTIQAAVGGIMAGPFAYAERWNEETKSYAGLVVESASHAFVTIDGDSVIVRPDVAEVHHSEPGKIDTSVTEKGGADELKSGKEDRPETEPEPGDQQKPTRFTGTVSISSERPARDMHQVVEGIVEQLTTLPDAEVNLKLEIDAEVPSGLDSAKVRTLTENANTLKFTDKSIK